VSCGNLFQGSEGWVFGVEREEGTAGRKEGRKEREMEKMFGPAYTGDPGVPHSDKDAFSSIFWGSVAFSAYSIVCPYYWEQCNNTFK
jgi:hypothetical protein